MLSIQKFHVFQGLALSAMLCFGHVAIAQDTDQKSEILPENVNRLGIALLDLVERELAGGEERVVGADDYEEHPYWVAVFALGNAVPPDLRRQLEIREALTPIENLVLGAARCTHQKENLDILIRRYQIFYEHMPRHKGMQMRELLPYHITPDFRGYWEMLLLSPRISQLNLQRCMMALSKCGNRHTFGVMRKAQLRIFRNDGSAHEWRDDIQILNVYILPVFRWINIVLSVDRGGLAGLQELLYILETVEKEYPQISSLNRFKNSPFFTLRTIGITESLLIDVFPS